MNHPGTQPKTRVLLVDDSPEILSAWTRFLSREPDLELVGTLVSLAGLPQAVAALAPDVLVLDVSVGDRDGLLIIPSLHALAQHLRVIVYSGRTDAATLSQVRAAGAAGFIGKHQDPKLLLSAIRQAARHGQSFQGQSFQELDGR